MWPGLWPGSTGPDFGPNWNALGFYSYLTIARCTGVPKNLMVLDVVLCVVAVWTLVDQTGLVWFYWVVMPNRQNAQDDYVFVAVLTTQ
jgi:hypothetical protein